MTQVTQIIAFLIELDEAKKDQSQIDKIFKM